MRLRQLLVIAVAMAAALAAPAMAQTAREPLRITITDGVIEPLPISIPQFVPDTPAAAELARDITAVIGQI